MFKAVVLALALSVASASSLMSFEDYVKTYNKAYTVGEFRARRALFMRRVKEIEIHNANLKRTFDMGINHLTDATETELGALRGFNKAQWRQASRDFEREDEHAVRRVFNGLTMPESFDWRDLNKVTPVKNQGSCGSCWAFSGVGTIEANLLINNQTETILAEQQYVDCVPNPDECGGTGGCQGATQPLLFNYSLTEGAELESDYAYTAATGTCHESDYSPVVTVEGYGILPENCEESVLKGYLLAKGPIAVSVDASAWSGYSSGVLSFDSCGSDIDHAVLLVGYGTDEEYGDYWTIKNSWGTSWGEDGFIRISRQDGFMNDTTPSDGVGCADGPSYAIIRGTCGIQYANSFVYGAKLA